MNEIDYHCAFQSIGKLNRKCKELTQDVEFLLEKVQQLEYHICHCKCGSPMHPKKPDNQAIDPKDKVKTGFHWNVDDYVQLQDGRHGTIVRQNDSGFYFVSCDGHEIVTVWGPDLKEPE